MEKPIRVLFVCCGNTCRSPMAQSVFADMLKKKGSEDRFKFNSSGTHVPEPGRKPSYRTVICLEDKKIPVVKHTSRQLTNWDYVDYDYLIGMDSFNVRDINRISGGDPDGKIYRLLDFTDLKRDIVDPYVTEDYETTYRDIVPGLEGFWNYLEKHGII